MALAIAQDFLYQAFRRCGQMRPGYTVQPELFADGLNEWEAMFDAWAAQRTMGFSNPDFVYAVTGPGSQSGGNGYQVGPTAEDWVGPRPNMIFRANLVMTNLGTQPVYLPIRMLTQEEWASLAIRQIPAINVTNLAWYDPQFPNGVFNVFPPLNGNSIELFCNQALVAPATLATSYSGPPGYMEAVIASLGERLWPLCSADFMPRKQPLGALQRAAYEARRRVQNTNRPIPTLRNDFAGGTQGPAGYYDSFVTYTGEPY